jgi:hypothetical protein
LFGFSVPLRTLTRFGTPLLALRFACTFHVRPEASLFLLVQGLFALGLVLPYIMVSLHLLCP